MESYLDSFCKIFQELGFKLSLVGSKNLHEIYMAPYVDDMHNNEGPTVSVRSMNIIIIISIQFEVEMISRVSIPSWMWFLL